jgi:hypothetical protein
MKIEERRIKLTLKLVPKKGGAVVVANSSRDDGWAAGWGWFWSLLSLSLSRFQFFMSLIFLPLRSTGSKHLRFYLKTLLFLLFLSLMIFSVFGSGCLCFLLCSLFIGNYEGFGTFLGSMIMTIGFLRLI